MNFMCYIKPQLFENIVTLVYFKKYAIPVLQHIKVQKNFAYRYVT